MENQNRVMVQAKLLGILAILVATSLFAGLAITPNIAIADPGDKDSPSDGDQGYGNDPGNSGDAHKKNNKRD